MHILNILFSCVELNHVAQLINLPQPFIEKKLSQMILDKSFSGILDQGKGHLVVFEPSADDAAFTNGLDIISNVGLVVDALSSRAKNIHKLPASKPQEEVKKGEAGKADDKKASKKD
jgi:26S proteasome regulatory subunit N6